MIAQFRLDLNGGLDHVQVEFRDEIEETGLYLSMGNAGVTNSVPHLHSYTLVSLDPSWARNIAAALVNAADAYDDLRHSSVIE